MMIAAIAMIVDRGAPGAPGAPGCPALGFPHLLGQAHVGVRLNGWLLLLQDALQLCGVGGFEGLGDL